MYIKFLGPRFMWGMERVSGNEMIAWALQMIGIFDWMILIYCRNNHQWELSKLPNLDYLLNN